MTKISRFSSKAFTTSTKRVIAYERLNESVKNISAALVSKTNIVLGKGRFATCVKGYLQGTSICIKINYGDKSSTNCKVINLITKEANILSQLGHPAVCFIIGIQTHIQPYYLITNLYEVRGYALTLYDLLFPNDILETSKKDIAFSVHCEIKIIELFNILLKIGEGMDYCHQKNIVHRDLKADNVALYEQNNNLMPVIIDFGKSDVIKNTKQYSLTEEQKKEYRINHKHIAPDLVDGIAKPSPSSDIYSYGRIFKSVVRDFPISPKNIPPDVVSMVNNCLSYDSLQRPNGKFIISTLKATVVISS